MEIEGGVELDGERLNICRARGSAIQGITLSVVASCMIYKTRRMQRSRRGRIRERLGRAPAETVCTAAAVLSLPAISRWNKFGLSFPRTRVYGNTCPESGEEDDGGRRRRRRGGGGGGSNPERKDTILVATEVNGRAA